MSFILDLILIGIIVAICVNAYIQGLIVSLFNLVSSFAAMILAFLLCPVLAGIIELSPIYGGIKDPIYNSLLSVANENGIKTTEGLLKQLPLHPAAMERIKEQVANESITEVSAIAGKVSELITSFIIQIISIIILFIIIKLLLLLVKGVLKKINKLPIIRQTDKIGGVILGIIEAFVLLTVVGALFALFSGSVDSKFMEAVENSLVGKFFYECNFLISYLKSLI